MIEYHVPRDDEPRRDGTCIADSVTMRTLNDLTRPLGRSALSVVVIVVADALAAIRSAATLIIEERKMSPRTHLALTDRSAPFLARLLEADLETDLYPENGGIADGPTIVRLGDGQSAHLLASVILYSDSVILELHHDHAEKQDTVPLTAVIDCARLSLQYLAASGASSRWTEPLSIEAIALDAGRGPSVSQHFHRRWKARRSQETEAAVRILTRWLRLDDLPPDGVSAEQWWARIQMGSGVRLLLATWCQWLRDQDILAPDEGILRPLERLRSPRDVCESTWDRPVRDMVDTLIAQETLIQHVLSGDAPSTDLLAVPELRPNHLVAAEPDLMPVWQQIGNILQEEVDRIGRPLALVDLGGASQENPHLSAVLDHAGITSTVLPAGRPYSGNSSFDAVLAVSSLHRWADPKDAAGTAFSLLRPKGALIAMENTELMPLGMLIAGLLENGFTDASGRPIDAPTQDEATWLRLLDAVGLPANSTPVGPTPAVLIRAQRTSDNYSWPMSVEYLEGQAGPVRPGTETEIALLWAELLKMAPRDRADSFFELGGDSLRATRFIAAVQKRYGITIAMRELFARPHLFTVARRIDAAISETDHETHEEGVL